MSACAERWEDEGTGKLGEPVALAGDSPAGGRRGATEMALGPVADAAERSERGGGDQSGGWNVLTTELVSYPPVSKRIWLEPGFAPVERSEAGAREGRGDSHLYANAWLEAELDRLAARRRTALSSTALSSTPVVSRLVATPTRGEVGRFERSSAPLGHKGDTTRATAGDADRATARRPRPARSVSSEAGSVAGRLSTSPSRRLATRTHAAPTRASAAATEPRGLRRLLPGAATLAVLVAAWFGVGAVANAAHHVQPRRLPGSVQVHGGLVYVVQPGDTLWSIASRVEPGADPRPLVAQLQAQLRGQVLLPGDRLLLPG